MDLARFGLTSVQNRCLQTGAGGTLVAIRLEAIRTTPFVVALALVCTAVQAEKIPQGIEFQVSSYTFDGQRRSAICSDAAANFVAVWEDENDLDGSDDAVFGQRFDRTGNRLGTEFQANTYTFGDQGYVDICCADSGSFVVVWQSEEDQDGSGYGVFGQRYDSLGTRVGTEFQVNTYTSGDQQEQKICCDAAGNFVVVWRSPHDGDDPGVFAQRYQSNGMPAGTEFQVNTYTFEEQYEPDICCGEEGSFVVAWAGAGVGEGDGQEPGIFSQRFDSLGAPVGTEFLVNTYTRNEQDEPSICCDDPGGFVVVWTSSRQDGSADGIFGQRYDSNGGARGTEFRVNNYTSDQQQDADVCCDSLGNFVVAWESYYQDGYGVGVFCRKFDAGGSLQGDETQVNTYTVNRQFDPAVSCDDEGGFVVVWTSLEQDGNNFGIFGQRFGRFGVGARSVPILSWIGLFVLSALLVVGGVRKARRRRA